MEGRGGQTLAMTQLIYLRDFFKGLSVTLVLPKLFGGFVLPPKSSGSPTDCRLESLWVVYMSFLKLPTCDSSPNDSDFFFFFFMGPPLQPMEVPRPGVKLELQLPAYTTATAMPDTSHVCDLHHSSWQRWILNPLTNARD